MSLALSKEKIVEYYKRAKEKREKYYEKAFERLEKEKKHTWNWAAFFFTDMWMLHRKMYLYTFLSIIFSVFLSFLIVISSTIIGVFLTALSFSPKTLCLITHLCVPCFGVLLQRTIFGYFGNYLYYRSVKRAK